jgi:dTDP-4-amino-4,6-dideoxygalactose transaminase
MDVNLDTHVTTLAEVMRAVKSGVKAVVVTHLYGLAIPEIAEIAKYCAANNIPLLEDCAQAHGAEINGKRVGAFGDAASFSFYPTKNLGALGDGGAVVTNHSAIAEKVQLLRQYGWVTKYKVGVAGGRNSRLDEIKAAILSEFLPDLDTANARRRDIAAAYSKDIKQANITLPSHSSTDYVAHLYIVRTPQRDSLRAHLQKNNIASDVHYPIPDYQQPVCSSRFANISLPNTEKLATEILTLPCYPEMTDTEVNYVITSINGWQV